MSKTCHVWYQIECFDKYNSYLSKQKYKAKCVFQIMDYYHTHFNGKIQL